MTTGQTHAETYRLGFERWRSVLIFLNQMHKLSAHFRGAIKNSVTVPRELDGNA
jgi:hypothetical protein